MKAVKKSTLGPALLVHYAAANPNNTWEQFRKSDARYRQTKTQLHHDQRGLCAYCEINLILNPGNAKADDFRIEHFHPKSPHAPPPNWALDWTNLLGCCHGGSSKKVSDPSRYDSAYPSCDVPKGNSNWVGVILDPQAIPPLAMLFSFKSNGADAGEINVDTARCPPQLQQQAADSIVKLKLNATRLKLARKASIEKMTAVLEALIAEGNTANPAGTLASQFLDPQQLQWTAFPTCTRWVLGAQADQYLTRNNFAG